ncbi:ParB N-terminal domain-containing protein [Kosmotoga olearia]|uniref:ParB N-terminal domain-containing protein n=1 Tax=Kosmotoga olearia TaxID=651457 RepID=UPI003B431435
MELEKAFLLHLDKIQPSQLYISQAKLKRVLDIIEKEGFEALPPIPVIRLKGFIIYTDGHTRAMAAYLSGLEEVLVYWDEDELDLQAYEICVDWCLDEEIKSISDLKDRIIPHSDYEILWYERCRKMQEDLENKKERR